MTPTIYNIGDLVLVNGKVRRIEHVDRYTSDDGTVYYRYSCDDGALYFAPQILPLPLSIEFLRTNHWHEEQHVSHTTFRLIIPVEKKTKRSKGSRIITITFIRKLHDEVSIYASVNGLDQRSFAGYIQWVHDLQQALRIVGHHAAAQELTLDN